MHLDLLQSLSLCGDLDTPNDDRGGASARRAWVIDGATDLAPPGLLGDRGGAAWLAATADGAFGLAEGADLGATCAAVYAIVAERYGAERRREPAGAWEVPSASFAAIQLVGDSLDVAWAGDCAILRERADGTVDWLTPAPDRAAESAEAAALGDALGAVRTPAVIADRRAARERPGRRVLGVDAAASGTATEHASVTVAPGDHLLLMSDGFAALVDSYHAYDPPGLMDAVCARGLAALAEQLRAIEYDDPACRRYPRFKCSDDATALWVRVGPYHPLRQKR
ncbi:protein phosphatase 2C domain-containing protein [Sphingomonas yunnanensis]|uniref:protein phosphatase 2C domain-containing protein n=1 Tax=Sphingomonas yunnanensis TaxID=310400 RepID=UPI001CA75B9E|nr:protein phosphatase 2C domain-containing protein [Sphingomonas yunnanensis]MBY9062545.1 protein phosphatase 2C domain-containing protein [Sphingomonas yunnanensis]